MKICQFCSTNFEGLYYASLARALMADGHEMLYVTLEEQRVPAWMQTLPGVRHLSLKIPSRWQYPLAALKLAWWLRRENVTVLQTHLFDAGLIGMLAARLAGVPLRLVARHHLDEVQLLGTRWHVMLDQWMARQADGVIVPSQAVRRYMAEAESLSAENIEVIPPGFDFATLTADEDDRQRVRAEFGLSGAFVLGCVGRLFKNKGHIYLFQALHSLLADMPDARILLVGDGDRGPIEEMLAELGLQDRVVFAGYRRDIAACMKALDVMVHPSLSESFGQVLVEAMAVGTPVIATTVGGVPEIVSHLDTGLLAPPRDADALARAIRQLYFDPQLRRQLAVAGQQSVWRRFTAEKLMQDYVEFYRRYERARSSNGKSYVRA